MGDSTPTDVDDILIRRATEADADAIGMMWEKLVAYHRDLDERLPEAVEDGGMLYARRIAERIHDSHTGIFVAEADGELVGFTLGLVVDLVPEMFRPQMGGFLADIHVEDAYRRRGVGSKLVEALAGWFRSRGVGYMEWYAATANETGRAFWESLGGREVMTRMRVDL